MSRPEDPGSARVSRLRELLEAEEQKAGSPPPAGGDRSRLILIGGAAAAVLVTVLLLFLVLPGGGGSGVDVPPGASETSVSVFPSRIPASVGKGQQVNICGRSGQLIAGNVLVVERHTADQLIGGELVVLDVYATPEDVGRLSSEKAADLRVVRGSCASSPEASSTTATTAPAAGSSAPPVP